MRSPSCVRTISYSGTRPSRGGPSPLQSLPPPPCPVVGSSEPPFGGDKTPAVVSGPDGSWLLRATRGVAPYPRTRGDQLAKDHESLGPERGTTTLVHQVWAGPALGCMVGSRVCGGRDARKGACSGGRKPSHRDGQVRGHGGSQTGREATGLERPRMTAKPLRVCSPTGRDGAARA